MPTQKHVLVVGEHRHREFFEIVAWLQQKTQLSRFEHPQAALRYLRPKARGRRKAATPPAPPTAIFLAQARPGRFSARQVEQLHAAAPLARLGALLGGWCEGEERSGQPWPGVARIYWREWPWPAAEALLTEDASEWVAGWDAPRAADAEERMLIQAERPAKGRGLIVIDAHCRDNYESLSDAFSQAGYSTIWSRPGENCNVRGAAAVLWSEVGLQAKTAQRLKWLVEQYQPAPVIAVLDFLRWQDRRQALEIGAQDALAQPFWLDQLLLRIEGRIRL